MIDKKDLRDWLFRGLMFEADAERFRSAGIRVGVDTRESERQLLEESISAFSIDIRNEALQMGRLYVLINCFENAVRALIEERLAEVAGINWWEDRVPKKVREFAESRQKKAEDEAWLQGQKHNLLGFTEFGHLSDIVIQNWEDFADLYSESALAEATNG